MSLTVVPIASVWTDIAGPLIVALVGGTIAAFWPWLQAFQRGRKFTRLIRRELEEIGPDPDETAGKPWWEHATKRFVHEEIFHRDNISQNRDFLLSLDPTVVYQVSQLWIALEKRDRVQWMYFLDELADRSTVRSEDLRTARNGWKRVIEGQRAEWLETMGLPTRFRQEAVLGRIAPLFEKRCDAYSSLLSLTNYGPEADPKDLEPGARRKLADELSEWFYTDGAGLLLSGRSLDQFIKARDTLGEADASPRAIWNELSLLRTDLKIDLGVRQPRERDKTAWPEEERW